MQIAFQLTELFQIEIDAVIYTVLKKVKEFYNKKRPSKGWSGVHLLHDNASYHKCEVVKSFLASEKVKVLNLWDRWVHSGAFENGVLLMYTPESVGSVANFITAYEESQ